MGHHRAEQRPVQLRPRRPDRLLRRVAQHARPRPQPGLARPAALLGQQPAGQPGAGRHGRPHHHGSQPLQGEDLRLGRGQRALQRRRLLRQRRLLQGDGLQLLRRGPAYRARRRPRRQALHQRLQHRRPERQEQRPVQPGQVPAVPGRPPRRHRLREPLHRRPGPLRLPGEHAALRRPRPGRCGHRARRPHATARLQLRTPAAGHRLRQHHQGLPGRLPLRGRLPVGRRRRQLLDRRHLPRLWRRHHVRPQLPAQAGLQLHRDRPRRELDDHPAAERRRGAARGGCGQVPGRAELLDHGRYAVADLGLQRPGQPELDAYVLGPADGLLRQQPVVHGRLQQPDLPGYQGRGLVVQRRRQPAVERQLQRHRHQHPVRTVPRRHRSLHRQRRPRRTVDLQRRQQPAMDAELNLYRAPAGQPAGAPLYRHGRFRRAFPPPQGVEPWCIRTPRQAAPSADGPGRPPSCHPCWPSWPPCSPRPSACRCPRQPPRRPW
ncbi:hypothetical protein SCOCK_370072 [Actinacidiphila cocklensis]|uniref:Uncharacterized protein n=1 Tax=Actinacidiphila cocklensis TaxID=887465 RepID=A0A9W4E937_9ACTN|nr:hypothetical protein SCOCK_370072 [Actinacidiphila cocklensis]